MQYPALSSQENADHGFGHLVETDEVEMETIDNQVSSNHMSDLNALQQTLLESEAKVKPE